MTTTANASSNPWMSVVVVFVDHLGVLDSSARQGLDEQVELDAARRLDQDDVAVAQPAAQEVERGLAIAGLEDARRVEAGGLRARPRSRRRPARPTTSRSTVAAAAVPTSRWPVTAPLPSSSISPRTATRRPGRPASRSSAAVTDGGDAL